MSRNLKALGLALVASFAMSAVVASAASAEAYSFKADTVPTTLTGNQHAGNDVFTTDTGTVSCNIATYEGTQTVTPTNSVTVKPSYGECRAFGLFNVPIHVNGCEYKFTAGTKVSGNYEGTVDIVCPTGKFIEVTAPGCLVTVGAQNNLGKVTYTNIGIGATKEVTVDVNITGLAYEEHRPPFGICTNNTVPQTDGTYVGAGLVTGENPVTKAHHGVFVG